MKEVVRGICTGNMIPRAKYPLFPKLFVTHEQTVLSGEDWEDECMAGTIVFLMFSML
jgi:hypothetical protein